MSKLTRTLFLVAAVGVNLAVGAARARADYIHTAAYDPAQGKWIVVCTSCLFNCDCTINQT